VLDPGLNGRVALVTGANQGIGAATARALAAHGVAVLLTYLRLDPAAHAGEPYPAEYGQARAAGAEQVARQIRDGGGTAETVEADLADPDVREQAVAGSPLRHLAQPDEVAEVIVLLASHQARHITGQVVRMS
jgi:NAD(P)-dependent dehydrogenase (short-subunit alcohol dehydrogenase family)